MNSRVFKFLALNSARAWRHGIACVGLIVFLGCMSFLIAPEDNFAPPHKGVASAQIPRKVLPPAMPPMIIIDPGHGGIDEGTKYYGLAEKDVTLDVAQRLERILKGLHVNTTLTRRDDVYVALPARVQIANDLYVSNTNTIFLSIHFNQSSVESVDGIETYYADQKMPPPTDWTWLGFFTHPENAGLDNGENLAADVQNAVVSRMLVANRGIKSRSLYVVRHTRMPAILVEGGFLSNKIENQMLRNDDYRDRLAQGLAAGLMTYVQSMHVPPPPPHLAMASN